MIPSKQPKAFFRLLSVKQNLKFLAKDKVERKLEHMPRSHLGADQKTRFAVQHSSGGNVLVWFHSSHDVQPKDAMSANVMFGMHKCSCSLVFSLSLHTVQT